LALLNFTCSENGSTGVVPGALVSVPFNTTITCGLQPGPVAGGLPFEIAAVLLVSPPSRFPFPAGGEATALEITISPKTSVSSRAFDRMRTTSLGDRSNPDSLIVDDSHRQLPRSATGMANVIGV
jgi:hypothetical protein